MLSLADTKEDEKVNKETMFSYLWAVIKNKSFMWKNGGGMNTQY